MAANPFTEVSIASMNSLEKSGYLKTVAVTNASFKVSNAS